MAETVQASSFKETPVKLWEAGIISRSFTHPSSTALDVAGDILVFYALPRGAKMLEGELQPEQLDFGDGAGADRDIIISAEVTDGATTKTLIDESAAGASGGLARPSKAPTDEDAIGFVIPSDGWAAQIRVTTAANVALAGSIYFHISYTMDLEIGEAP